MTQLVPVSTSRLANEVARLIYDGFTSFHDSFREITRRAAVRFASRDWHALQDDARARLKVRDLVLRRLLVDVRSRLADRLTSRIVWVGIKAVYSGLINDRDDWEIAETFFNTVTRRVFATVGIDEEVEFVHTDYPTPPTHACSPVYRTYEAASTVTLLQQVLRDHPELGLTEDAIAEDAKRLAARLTKDAPHSVADGQLLTAQFARPVFYRGDHAYLMGRGQIGPHQMPLVLCFTHDDRGPRADALLLNEEDVRVLFSFTRSYFQVDVERPYDMVAFIRTLMPRKNAAEIYISLGYSKHGKTELYRHALHHLAHTTDNYELAEGQRGMVMVVFTMPSYPVVFKVIRDQFDYPKECSRSSVIDRYRLIFKHDRAGRLVDAQEYEYLVLDRSRFAPELIDELLAVAGKTVSIVDGRVVIKHCYAERRVTPLNVFLQHADEESASAAVIDYGQAIKDLAFTNLFPGDLLPKNFGVTRSGRVVFYDYDEVCLLDECNFRKIPPARTYEDEMSGEPWFSVGPSDIFPEEFINFLGLSPALRSVFVQRHADLLDAEFWNALKKRIADGELFHVAPYGAEKRIAAGQPKDLSAA